MTVWWWPSWHTGWFWRKNSHSPLEIQDFEEFFLFSIEWDFANRFSSQESKFWEKKLSFSSWLNFSSNSGEKSYFAIWLDFAPQCFAERESILKRQFCVVEQYSDFSLQKHFMETSTTKSLLWEGMVAQWKGQMQNMQEWDRRLICMESEDQRRRRRDWIFLLYLILATIKWIIIALTD